MVFIYKNIKKKSTHDICPGESFGATNIELLPLANLLLSFKLRTPRWDHTRELKFGEA